MLEHVDVDRDTVARAYLLCGLVAGFVGLWLGPMVFGALTFVFGAVAVWFERPAAGVVVAVWGTVLVTLAAYW